MGRGSGIPVIRDLNDGIYRITIDRPDQRNALNDAVANGITAGLREAQADPAARVVVISGAGDQAFCAGGDLRASSAGSVFRMDPAHPRNPVSEMFREFERCYVPTIARVNGHALAGGLGLVCACDLAIADERATLGVPESSIGLFPMMILPFMQRTMPRRKLLEWCITGVRWSASEALEAGLLNYVATAGELDNRLDWLLSRVLDKSPVALRLGKVGLSAIQDMTNAQAGEYTQLMLAMMAQTGDAREGFAAFTERRKPVWTGQ